MPKYTYKMSTGRSITTDLTVPETNARIRRLRAMVHLLEGYTEGEGQEIFRKAVKALSKSEGFTGIIRLNRNQKDFLSYIMHDQLEYLIQSEIDALCFYTK